jgi:hypothetical protein
MSIRPRSGRKSWFINRTEKLASGRQPAVMHFYSGPPMHLRSGADTAVLRVLGKRMADVEAG